MNFQFFFNSIVLGIGLAMDAFSVSLANGLNEQNMKKGKAFGVAGTFAFFQGLMLFLSPVVFFLPTFHFLLLNFSLID